MGGASVDITVAFSYEDQHWKHIFQVPEGATILSLKERMLQPKGTKADVDSFELRLRGQRVSDAETIHQEHTLDFAFLGPDEGSKRAREDEQDRLKREKERAEATKRKVQSSPPAAPATAARAAAPPAPAEAAPVGLVKVVVKHAMEDQKSQVELEVPSSATVGDLRAALMAVLGETKKSEVKLVKRQANSFATLVDTERIGDRREFLSMGRTLEASAGASAELNITVIIDRDMDFKSTMKVPRGTVIAKFKEMLAAADPTGESKPDTFGLGLPSSNGPVLALPDATVLSEAHLTLEITEPYKEAPPAAEKKPRKVEAAFEELPAIPLWRVVGGADKGGILVRQGQQTTSPQLPDRLATGSIVEQVELEGERLCYKKISGTGPETGWVSLSVSGKELMQRANAGEPDVFTWERARGLQMDLLAAFGDADFQRRLQELREDHPARGLPYAKGRSEIILAAQRAVLPKYGFDGSARGAMMMMGSFGHLGGIREMQMNAMKLEQLLGQ